MATAATDTETHVAHVAVPRSPVEMFAELNHEHHIPPAPCSGTHTTDDTFTLPPLAGGGVGGGHSNFSLATRHRAVLQPWPIRPMHLRFVSTGRPRPRPLCLFNAFHETKKRRGVDRTHAADLDADSGSMPPQKPTCVNGQRLNLPGSAPPPPCPPRLPFAILIARPWPCTADPCAQRSDELTLEAHRHQAVGAVCCSSRPTRLAPPFPCHLCNRAFHPPNAYEICISFGAEHFD